MIYGRSYDPDNQNNSQPELLLERALNGGWTIRKRDDRTSTTPQIIAAYSGKADLLDGLTDLLD